MTALGIVIFSVVAAVTPGEDSRIIFGIFLYLFVCLLAIGIDVWLYVRHLREQEQNALREADSLREDYNDQLEYYSMWVHQIRTPISALRLMIQSDASIADKGDYYAEIFRIEQDVDMVLQYLRLRNIADDTVFVRTDVYSLARDSVEKFSPISGSRHLSVDVEFFDRMVYTDEKWLAFILEQFLSNSLKYSNEGTIRIYGRSEGDDWALMVRDEGIGISAEDIPRIFEKGYTGTNGRTNKKATGIGLYLAKIAADRLGLRLSVESVLGEGTTAQILFPKDVLC